MSLETRLAAFIAALGPDIKALFGRSMPPGGTTNQVLAKTAVTDYAAAWVTPGAGGSASIASALVAVPSPSYRATSVVVAAPGITPAHKVVAMLVGDSLADHEAEDLADWSVSATAVTDAVIFHFACPGVFGGAVNVNYLATP